MITLGLDDTTENLDCFCFQPNLAQLNMAFHQYWLASLYSDVLINFQQLTFGKPPGATKHKQ